MILKSTQWFLKPLNILAELLSRHDFNKLAHCFPLLTHKSSPETRRSPGIPTLAFPGSQPATTGGASTPIPDVHTILPAGAMRPAMPQSRSTSTVWIEAQPICQSLTFPACSALYEESGSSTLLEKQDPGSGCQSLETTHSVLSLG